MHELGIVEQVVELAAERAEGAAVRKLVLEIGRLSTVMPDAVRFCFDLATEGTVLAGAELEIVEKDGLAKCRACGGDVVLERPIGRCTCGGIDLEWVSGMQVRILTMEVR
jgi:hydrogenase nickel incorporation protein HypA/HybF